MIRTLVLASLLFALRPSCAVGQGFDAPPEYWIGYITSAKVSPRWSVWNDFHLMRRTFFVTRHGMTYQLYPGVQMTMGYAWLSTATASVNRLVRPEHRPWGQLEARFPLCERLQYRFRLRYEARFRRRVSGRDILDDYVFNHRIRLMHSLRLEVGRLGSRRVYAHALFEGLFQFGPEIGGNKLDQGRIFLMPGLEITPKLSVMAGYHHRYLGRSDGGLRLRHGWTAWVIQSF